MRREPAVFWLLIVVVLATLLLTSCAPGIVKMGLRVKVDIFGAKVEFKLPLEVYPQSPDGGWPPEHAFKD